MSPNKLAFCSVAFAHKVYGNTYIEQQQSLKQSIEALYQPHEYELFFYTNEYPPNSRPFLDSLYGFKPHAIQAARNAGYTHVIWLDTAMILHHRLDYYEQFLLTRPIIAIKDETCLAHVVSDKCLAEFGYERKDVATNNLVGGSFYYFDFSNTNTVRAFTCWLEAESKGLFGSQDEESAGKLQGHRHDEAVMALCLKHYLISPLNPEPAHYNREDGVIIKKHFK